MNYRFNKNSMNGKPILVAIFAIFALVAIPAFAEMTTIKKYVETKLQLERVASIARNYINSHETKIGKKENNQKEDETKLILIKNIYYSYDSEEGGLWYVETICESGSHYTICVDEKNSSNWLRHAEKYFGEDALLPQRIILPEWK